MNQPRPFNITIFVAEGIPDGFRLVEKSNWVGLSIVCPRGRYPQVKARQEFSSSGVYILIGRDGTDDSTTIYIGEAESVRARLDSHYVQKDFWQQAVVFTTKGNPLNKAEVRYLEARLIEIAAELKRCKLENSTMPQRPNLTESDRAEVEGYLDEALTLLPVLGVDVFERAVLRDQRIYYFAGSGWKATGYETSSGFAVRKGSWARSTIVPSMKKHAMSDFNKRQRLIDGGIVELDELGYVFTVDHEFSSPSQAASVCAGRSSNGRVCWKDDKGVTLKEHQLEASQE